MKNKEDAGLFRGMQAVAGEASPSLGKGGWVGMWHALASWPPPFLQDPSLSVYSQGAFSKV